MSDIGRKLVTADISAAVDGRGEEGIDLDFLFSQGFDQAGVFASFGLDQKDLGSSSGMREAFGDIVDSPTVGRVAVGDELGDESVKTGFGDDLLEGKNRDSTGQVNRNRLFVASGWSSAAFGIALKDL